jgi:hypothetical protein
MHNASMVAKNKYRCSHSQGAHTVLTWGQTKQDSASVRIVIWFQGHNRKPASPAEFYESILLGKGKYVPVTGREGP